MKYYYMKYWESNHCITVVETESKPDPKRGTVFVQVDGHCRSYVMHLGKDCFLTLEEAQEKIDRELKSRILSTQKKLDRLQKLQLKKFDVLP
jgi:hypothetical protein